MPHHNSYFQISSDGLIAVGDPEGKIISIIDPHINRYVHPSIRSRKNEMFIRMVFYPRGSVLAVSSMVISAKTPKHFVRYLDLKTLKFICRTEQLGFNWDYDFSFSPDGREIIIAFEKSGRTFPVPVGVRYEDKTKEKFPYMLFLLQKYIDKHQEILDQKIPLEITQLLAHTLLGTCER